MSYLVEKHTDDFSDSSNYYLESGAWGAYTSSRAQVIGGVLATTWNGDARFAEIVETHHPDQWVEIEIPELFTANDHISGYLRGDYDATARPSRPFRGYIISCRYDGLVIERHNLDYAALLPGDTSAMVAGDVIRAEILGSVLTIFKNGTLLLTITNNEILTGQPGLIEWVPNDDSTGTADNFRCGELLRADSLTPTLNGSGDIDLDLIVNSIVGVMAFWVVTNSAALPTETQIVAGEDHNGNAAILDGSVTITSLTQTVNITGVPNNQTLYAHAAVVDIA